MKKGLLDLTSGVGVDEFAHGGAKTVNEKETGYRKHGASRHRLQTTERLERLKERETRERLVGVSTHATSHTTCSYV